MILKTNTLLIAGTVLLHYVLPAYAQEQLDSNVQSERMGEFFANQISDSHSGYDEVSSDESLPLLAHFEPVREAEEDTISPVAELEKWRAKVRSNGFLAEEGALLSNDARLGKADVSDDLVYFYFSQGLMPEALKFLESIPTEHRTQKLTTLEAAAQLKLGRPARALQILDTPRARAAIATAPWRAIALTSLGAFKNADIEFKQVARTSIPFEDFAAIFFLAQARTAYELGDAGRARRALEKLHTRQLSASARAERRLLEARVMLAEGKTVSAYPLLESLSERSVDAVTIEAKLELLRRDVASGVRNHSLALEGLSDLSVLWQSDRTDRALLEYKIELLDAHGRKIDALSARRRLVTLFPRADTAPIAADQIREALPRLLDDRDISPSDAAAGFYQNLDFAPPGHLGDVLIENTADALVALDLLSEAAELLRHQTYQRLRGVDRARVGAKLAKILLEMQVPDDALAVLNDTRLTRLPETLTRDRNLIQAKASFAVGRPDDALNALADVQDDEALLLHAQILTAGGDLAGAAMLYSEWIDGQAAPLDGKGNAIAIRAAALYAVIGDADKLSALQRGAAAKMTDKTATALFDSIAATNFEQAGTEFSRRYRAYFSIQPTAG